MGRRPWATPEQTGFLENYLLGLDRVKKEGTLKDHYNTIALDFLKIWPANPTDEDREKADNLSKVQAIANERRANVSTGFISPI